MIAGYLMVAGAALQWVSWYALGWAAIFVIMGHWMIRTEEEHPRVEIGVVQSREENGLIILINRFQENYCSSPFNPKLSLRSSSPESIRSKTATPSR